MSVNCALTLAVLNGAPGAMPLSVTKTSKSSGVRPLMLRVVSNPRRRRSSGVPLPMPRRRSSLVLLGGRLSTNFPSTAEAVTRLRAGSLAVAVLSQFTTPVRVRGPLRAGSAMPLSVMAPAAMSPPEPVKVWPTSLAATRSGAMASPVVALNCWVSWTLALAPMKMSMPR